MSCIQGPSYPVMPPRLLVNQYQELSVAKEALVARLNQGARLGGCPPK